MINFNPDIPISQTLTTALYYFIVPSLKDAGIPVIGNSDNGGFQFQSVFLRGKEIIIHGFYGVQMAEYTYEISFTGNQAFLAIADNRTMRVVLFQELAHGHMGLERITSEMRDFCLTTGKKHLIPYDDVSMTSNWLVAEKNNVDVPATNEMVQAMFPNCSEHEVLGTMEFRMRGQESEPQRKVMEKFCKKRRKLIKKALRTLRGPDILTGTVVEDAEFGRVLEIDGTGLKIQI